MAGVFFVLFCCNAVALAQDVIRYHRPSSSRDTRYDYHIALLRGALNRTAKEYGEVELEPSRRRMSQQRLLFILEEGHRDVDVVAFPTNSFRETRLTPVRIPLDKGLLGWRVFLIRAADRERVGQVRSVADLKEFVVGQGMYWPDVAVYRDAGFELETGNDYEGLFDMLSLGRFDIFPRGVEEAFSEMQARREQHPDLCVDQAVALHYPFARYFWVANTEFGDRLRERLTKGLEAMIADGTFDRLFHQYKDAALEQARLKDRIILRIDNATLPESVPIDRQELWYDPLR